MNALWQLDGVDWWHVAGWTMLHYLWLGALAGLAAGVCRAVLRSAPANVRYVVALASLATLAVLPVGIAVWVSANPQVADRPWRAMLMAESSVVALPVQIAPPARGSAGGRIDATQEYDPMETAAANDAPPSVGPIAATRVDASISPKPQSNPRPSRGLTGVVADAAEYVPWIWLVGTPLTFLLLATGIVGAERLRRASRMIDDGPIAEACARIAQSLRIGGRVTVAACERIAAPVLVGIVRPMILLPPAALTGWSPDEIEMVLLHELAHVRRWDNLVNLAQRLVESLLFFHPAVWLVSSWVRREREACCDAVVVGRTNRPHAYAEMLVALAAQMPRSVLFHPAAASAMAAGPLRGRIRRILKLEDDPMLISSKSLAVFLSGLLLAATLVVLNLPARGQAEETTTEVTEKNSVDQRGDDLSEVEYVKSLFTAGEQNPLQTRYYKAPPSLKRTLSVAFEGLMRDPFGPKVKFESRWHGDRSAFEITAPKNAHEAFFSVFVPQAVAAESKRTAASASDVDGFAEESTPEAAESNGVAGTRRYGMGGNLPIEVSDEEGQRIVSELLKDPAVQRASINRTPDGMQSLFVSIKEPAGKKAFLSWNTNSEGKLGCSIGFIETPGATSPAASMARQDVHDRFPSLEDQKFIKVPFVQGATSFKGGNSITILEVRGTAKTFKPGNIYWIKGTYTLRSHDRAMLAAYTTAMDAAHGTSPSLTVQSTNVDRGEGTFTLFLPMLYRGWPHVSFYADGESFGEVYFGTGDSVLKQWWGANEANDATPTEATETQQSDEDVRRVTIAISDDQTATAESQPGRLRLQIRKTESKSGKFPSLEDQKLADLAFRRLGLELEPIGEEDLKRVQAFGYNGGVTVAQNNGTLISWDDRPNSIRPNDILVGLHVWPTKSIQDVLNVLDRDDLAELNPLKFYLVRPQIDGVNPVRDVLVTGRISVKSAKSTTQSATQSDPRFELRPTTGGRMPLGASRGQVILRTDGPPPGLTSSTIAEAAAASGLQPPTFEETSESYGIAKAANANPMSAPAATDKVTLRYDGNTFDQWRKVWDVDGMTNSKLEALTALEAFSTAGYGREAASAIAYGAYSSDTTVAQHTRKCLSKLPADDRLAVATRFVEVLATDLSAKRRTAAARALAAIGPNAESALDILKTSLASPDRHERIASAAAIKMIVGKDQYQKPIADVLGEELGITVVESDGTWSALPKEGVKDGGKAFADFTEAVIKEQQQLFPDGKF